MLMLDGLIMIDGELYYVDCMLGNGFVVNVDINLVENVISVNDVLGLVGVVGLVLLFVML